MVCKQTLADFALGLKIRNKVEIRQSTVFLDLDQNFLELIELIKLLLEPNVEQLLQEKNNAQENNNHTFKPIIRSCPQRARNKSEAKKLAAIYALNEIDDSITLVK
ncbi:2109_t:CDS:2 [Funneliformis geosporum]|uniref:2109_t:CDS:1 n=1 Tax=Funneliformis geosporum TaxID=1117311 RepID=A0A9W4T027_9GLOM|nr:2109_t:CDS:2 [Funneliformis geosporum]